MILREFHSFKRWAAIGTVALSMITREGPTNVALVKLRFMCKS